MQHECGHTPIQFDCWILQAAYQNVAAYIHTFGKQWSADSYRDTNRDCPRCLSHSPWSGRHGYELPYQGSAINPFAWRDCPWIWKLHDLGWKWLNVVIGGSLIVSVSFRLDPPAEHRIG